MQAVLKIGKNNLVASLESDSRGYVYMEKHTSEEKGRHWLRFEILETNVMEEKAVHKVKIGTRVFSITVRIPSGKYKRRHKALAAIKGFLLYFDQALLYRRYNGLDRFQDIKDFYEKEFKRDKGASSLIQKIDQIRKDYGELQFRSHGSAEEMIRFIKMTDMIGEESLTYRFANPRIAGKNRLSA